MTNYRASDFEFEFDIGSLFEYETPVPMTQTEIGTRMVPFLSLDKFKPGSATIPPELDNAVKRIAYLLVASYQIGMGIRSVYLGGGADPVGSDAKATDVGRQRAANVYDRLKKEMDRIGPGLSSGVSFPVSSGGSPPVVANAADPKNRRVEVKLPATCQTFFAEYDLQSFSHPILGIEANPSITKPLDRFTQMIYVKQELDIRLADRARQALAGTIKQAKKETRKHVLDAARELSTVQLQLFGKYHAGMPRGFAADKLMSCFMKFANGEIRSPHPDFDSGNNKDRKSFGVGEPDSNHFFMFAEFAFLCIESDVEPDAWTQALPALLAPQEVFMHVYRENPVSPPPPVGSALPKTPVVGPPTHPLEKFGARNFRTINGNQTKGLGQSDAARIAALTAKYSAMGLVQLRDAATMNLLRAQML